MQVLAERYQVGVDAIAIRYCLDNFPSALVLSGTTDGHHLAANLKANLFELSLPEIEELSTFGIGGTSYWKERKQLDWN